MPRRPRDVTDAELSILEVLWEDAPRSVRELVDALYEDGTRSEVATVQKLLDRLAAKGCVVKEGPRGARVWRPEVERTDLIGRRLQDVADTLCDGSMTPLLSHLVSKTSLTDAEIEELRALIDRRSSS